MEKQDSPQSLRQVQLAEELKLFGFAEQHIQTALHLTSNKEVAAQIIFKLIEEGPQADLSIYKQQQSQVLPSFQKPVRPKMLFVVNGSLKMGKGKICAQVGHAVIGAYLQIEEEAKFQEKSLQRLQAWESSGSPKIVVKAPTEQQMLQIKNKLEKLKMGINTYLVEDAGHTQIKAGSKTVLAIGPAFSNEIDPFTEHLKLA